MFVKYYYNRKMWGISISSDGSFIIVYMGNEETGFELELTWLRDMDRPYNLGDCEFHLAFSTDDMDSSYKKHSPQLVKS